MKNFFISSIAIVKKCAATVLFFPGMLLAVQSFSPPGPEVEAAVSSIGMQHSTEITITNNTKEAIPFDNALLTFNTDYNLDSKISTWTKSGLVDAKLKKIADDSYGIKFHSYGRLDYLIEPNERVEVVIQDGFGIDQDSFHLYTRGGTPKEKGNLVLRIVRPQGSELRVDPVIKIRDSNKRVILSEAIPFDSSKTLNDLPAGSYRVTGSIVEGQRGQGTITWYGIDYPKGKSFLPVQIKDKETQTESLEYSPLPKGYLQVSSSATTVIPLEITNIDGSFRYVTEVDSGEQTTLPEGTYNILSVLPNGDFCSLKNVKIVPNKTKSFTLTYKKALYNKIGYIDYAAADTRRGYMIREAVTQGYNLIIVGFASNNGEEVSLDQLNKSTLFADIISARRTARKLGKPLKILISFGGQLGSYHEPKVCEIPNLVNNIEELCTNPEGVSNSDRDLYIDGVDFDIENKSDSTILAKITKGLKEQGLIVTIAPQLNNAKGDEKMHMVSSSTNQDYKDVIDNNFVDFIFLQEYNTGTACVTLWNGEEVCEGDPGFAGISYNYLIKNEIPPKSTAKVVIIAPATTYGANGQAGGGTNTANIFGNDNSIHAVENFMKDVSDNIIHGSDPDKFGGIGCWNINDDATGGNYINSGAEKYQQPWDFIKVVAKYLFRAL